MGGKLPPAVLPALRRVRIVDSELDHRYAIIGDPPVRRIVRLPSSTEDNVSAEKDIGTMSKGLLRLLEGCSVSKKEEKKDDGPGGDGNGMLLHGSHYCRRLQSLTCHVSSIPH